MRRCGIFCDGLLLWLEWASGRSVEGRFSFSNVGKHFPVVALALIGFALLLPTWLIIFRAFSVQERATGTNLGIITADAPDPALGNPIIKHSDIGARELMKLCASRTNVEMEHITKEHAGELLELSGVVFNVNTFWDASASITIDLDSTLTSLIHARVSDKDRVTRAVALRKGDKIKINRKIQDISANSISLIQCDFTRL
jgi:hypothetical protein